MSELGSLQAIFEAWDRPAEDFEVIDYGRHLLLKETDTIVAQKSGGIWSPCALDYMDPFQ